MGQEKKKFFYGWVIVAVLLVIAVVPMVLVSNYYSYYQVPICEDFGVSYTQFNISNIASTVACMIFSLSVATKMTQGNTKRFMFVGALVAAGAMFAQSQITAIWQLYLTFFVTNFAMSAITFVPINYLISQWFIDKKGLVTSVIFAGCGIGGLIFSKPLATLLAGYGWRAGFQLNAAALLVTALLILLLIRNKPSDMGLSPYTEGGKSRQETESVQSEAPQWEGLDKKEAVRTSAFFFYALAMICCGMCAAGVVTQVPTFLIENDIDYAAVMAVFSVTTIFGTIVLGPIIDKAGIKVGSLVASVIGMLALICLALVPRMGVLASYIGMGIIPFGIAITSLGPPLLVGVIFGYRDFGGIYGLGNALFMAGCMVGPVLASAIRDGSGSYLPAWITFAVVYLAITLFSVLAINASRKFKP